MDTAASLSAVTNRKPLGNDASRTNMRRTPPRSTKAANGLLAASSPLPHHESLMPNGPHTVQDAISPRSHKRLSTLTNDEQSESKRNSQVSTASTNASGKGKRRKTHIGPWQLGVVIGQGGIGKVRKVRHSVTGEDAAVKIIPKAVAERARAESLANLVDSSKRARAGVLTGTENIMPFGVEREVVILKLLEHPNIVKLYDVWENRNELYLIMEYVNGGELFGYISNRERVPEDETIWLFRQVVAALLHCHRLGIHHRDLKPENILVDPETQQVKLADFGMAALQPQGKLLTTPCGSMHYAAPEVFEKYYDGAKADVWSLGVILYVMLTGTTPFNYEASIMAQRVALWYNVLKAGKFEMPRNLSKDAQDLLKRMLTVEPKQRISLEAIWSHPFIHKYDMEWGETPNMTSVENWIGQRPLVRHWNVKTRADIDREILRNLRTLWHSEKEENLVQKLLSKEPNQEKYFYSALQRHRDEQLENYLGNMDDATSSGSDYHHVKPGAIPNKNNHAIPPIIEQPKTNSQYSVLNNEHLHSRSTLHEPPPSRGSYDPYRASRGATTSGGGTYIKINVSRGQSVHSDKHGRPASLRVETLKNGQRRVSATSSLSSLRQSSPSVRSRPVTARTISRSSMISSLTANSISGGIVKPSMHKRAVNFQHTRRSAASAGTSQSSSRTSTSPRKGVIKQEQISQPNLGSPAMLNTFIRSRKEAIKHVPPSRLRKSQTQDEVFDKEARKVSTELEKFCEEAFFRTSVGSSSRNSVTPSKVANETPPSSVSNQGSGAITSSSRSIEPAKNPYILPQRTASLNSEGPNVFIKQELAETRKRLATRYAHDENAQNATTYHDVLAHLDALIRENPTPSATVDLKRNGSGFTTRQSFLPVISEEDKQADLEFKQSSGLVTDDHSMQPLNKSMSGHLDKLRAFAQSPPPQIAPLVIRKVSGSSSGSQPRNDDLENTRYYSNTGPGKFVRKHTPTSQASFERMTEEVKDVEFAPQHDDVSGRQMKKSNWFRRKFQLNDSDIRKDVGSFNIFEDSAKVSSSEDLSLKARQMLGMETLATQKQQYSPASFPGKRPGFLRFLTRKKIPKRLDVLPQDDDMDEGHSLASTTALSFSGRGTPIPFQRQQHTIDQPELHGTRDLGVQRNWLARFLNIKPASKVLCFCTGRGRARQAIIRLLRNWEQYGIRDVVFDRTHNLIFGRLDAMNHLGIREVSFVVELYVMLKQGRKAGLSVARFVQRKGAASSLKRVVEAVEAVLRGTKLLVERGETWREMEAVLNAS